MALPHEDASDIFHLNEAYDVFIGGLQERDTELTSVSTPDIEQRCEDPLIRGDVIAIPFCLTDLLPTYVEERERSSLDHPQRDLEALHPVHFVRRSTRLQQRPKTGVASSANIPHASTSKLRTTKGVAHSANISYISDASTSRLRSASTNAASTSATKTVGKSNTRKRPAAEECATPASLGHVEKRVKLDEAQWKLPKDRKPTQKEKIWLNPDLTPRVDDRSWRTPTLATATDAGSGVHPFKAHSTPHSRTVSLAAPSSSAPFPPPLTLSSPPSSPSPSSPTAHPASSAPSLPPSLPLSGSRNRGARSDVFAADGFSLLEDASFSTTGWQGAGPPDLARKAILDLYREKPDGAALAPYLKHFLPVPYKIEASMTQERSTVFVDNDGKIFMECANEIACAHDILVGNDLQSDVLKKVCRKGSRGGHMPIIIGHQRQSAVKPRLTAWHERNRRRVEIFMALPIVTRIIRLVTDFVTRMFPGVARRFLADAQWHEDRYGIKPLCGLFWNLCLNAWFEEQERIHCDPHADLKNQIGVCVLLIYVLKCGANFNHTQRTWLVIWEATVVMELPPWTLAAYPSALLYHFNIDIHQIQFVTTEGNVRPTPENSRPITAGDERGRGSFVFFNQSTMRHGPGTGFDTLKDAKGHGLSGTVDYGTEAQEAFERHLLLTPIAPEDVV
ncbi:hypothetical protein C8R46DRAFT_1035834 [Mycena filopes]|nr:hypothetical protein C8R46DRAFT_1035834 [Mycena filopes]